MNQKKRSRQTSGEPASHSNDLNEKAGRKRAEEQLRESEERYRLIFNSSMDAILLTSPTGEIFSANPAACKMFQRTEEEICLLGRSCILDVSDPRLAVALEERARTGRFSGELTFIRRDGSKFPGEITSVVFKDKEGRERTSMVIRDISERKRAEENLRRSEERFRQITENMLDAVSLLDKDGVIRYVSPSHEKILGYKAEDLVGKTSLDFTHPEDVDTVKAAFDGIFEKGETRFQYRFRHSDGHYVWGEASAKVLRDDCGNVTGGVIASRDITERKRSEKALATERQRLSYILEGTNVGTWEWNVQTGEILFNERWAEIIGYTLDELAPVSIETWKKFAHPDDLKKSNDLLERHFDNKLKYYECEARMRHKDGSWVWVLDRGKVSTWTNDEKPLIMSGTHQDITERKRSEEALRESEEKFRTMADLSPAVIAILKSDEQGERFLYVNAAWETLTGYHRDDAKQLKAEDIVHPDMRERVVEQAAARMHGEDVPSRYENRIITKSGETRWLDFAAADIRYQGAPAILTMAFDITERKRSEERLRESEERFKVLFMSISDGFYLSEIIYDDDGDPCDYRYLEVNPRFEQILGLSRDQIIGKRFKEFVPIDTTHWLSNYCEVARTGVPRTYEFQSPEYQRHFETYSYQPAQGQVSVFVRDITDRKQTEEKLRESEQLFRSLFESSPNAVMLLDPHDPAVSWSIVDCNEEACRMNGYAREELIGQSIDILNVTQGTDEEHAVYLKRLREKGVVSLESFHRRKDGLVFPIEVSTSIVTVRNQELVLGIDRDITERKKAEEQIRNDLEEKEVLLKEIHHRVKNNLTVISSLLNLQSKQIKSKKQALEAFKESRDRVFAMALVHEKLYQSRDFASVDIKLYLDDMARQLIKMYRVSQDIRLKIDVKEASVDINRAIPCGLILNELITNALKYAFPNKRKGEITVSFRPFEETLYELIVSDNGVGLPDDLDIENSPSLGLHLVRLLTNQLNGTWSVSRKKGTTFSVQFPKKAG